MSVVRLADAASSEPSIGLLFERERELAAIEGSLAEGTAGRGSLALIEGPAGIGKTALLRAANGFARKRGFTVLNAQSTPLERDFSFGVVRQLFDPLGLETDATASELLSGAAALSMNALGTQRAPSGSTSEDVFFGTLHGLYWLTANLASQRPLLLVVDDCQWADSPSLRFLAHLGARLDGLPVVVLLGLRSGTPGSDAELLGHVVSLAAGQPIRPAALGAKSTARLVQAELGASATDRFCRACLDATGGNPLLLRTLLASIADEGTEPNDDAAGYVTTFGIESVARLLARQLGQLEQGAEPIARALAVLGAGAPLRQVAKLSGVGLERAAEIVDSLRAASIVAPKNELDFAHPILRVAVYDGIGRDACRLAHSKAAELLASEGAPPDRIALHLLHAQPRGDPTVVDTLRAAARLAEERGGPDTAAAYLDRALEEPPPPAARGVLLLELGQALMAAGRDSQAAGHLHEAVALMQRPEDRLRAALLGGRSLGIAGYFERAARVLELALDEVDDPAGEELGLLVEAELIANSWHIADRVPWALQRLAGYRDTDEVADVARPLMLVNLGFRSLLLGEPAEIARQLLQRALADGSLFRHESLLVIFAMMGLIWLDEFDIAEPICSEFVREGQRRGSASQASHVFPRALISLRRGWLRDAEADARWAFEQKLAMGRWEGKTWAWSFLLDALVERGELEAAESALAQSDFPTDPPETMGWAVMLEARGRLNVAQNRIREGLTDFLEAGKRWERLGWRGGTGSMWRAEAALALALLGEADEARRLAAEQLELARTLGLRRLIGVATRVAGTVAPRTEAVALLSEAVDLLEPTPARLELGRALVELGAALRRQGHRSAARDKLRQGLELAHRAGAVPLARRAREELIAAGGRPRRPFMTGVEALTASELRVARLAARGMMNREIAEQLFVTQRTVETHLHHAFQKLGISGRQDIPPELATPEIV